MPESGEVPAKMEVGIAQWLTNLDERRRRKMKRTIQPLELIRQWKVLNSPSTISVKEMEKKESNMMAHE